MKRTLTSILLATGLCAGAASAAEQKAAPAQPAAKAGAATPAAKPADKKELSPQESWNRDQEIFLRENYFHKDWKKTADGLQYLLPKTPADASKPKPAPGATVTVNYQGATIDGNVFDSTYVKGMPLTISLKDVIKGWQEGIPMMREGETWLFVVPASLGYGDIQTGPIPGGSALIFKVELVSASAAP